MDKLYLDANQLLDDSFELGFRILDSGFRPDLLLAIWRGGTPVAIAIQELLNYHRIPHHHFPIRTRHYSGIDHRRDEVLVDGLDHALALAEAPRQVLIVDDVHDTGLSIAKVIADLEHWFGPDRPEVRVATPYFKPGKNLTGRVPDFYLHATDRWIVFPHELAGLETGEIIARKTSTPALARHMKKP
ncbi:MAG: phosphoribosyltransferase family protein [Porticoccaceae bacterium]